MPEPPSMAYKAAQMAETAECWLVCHVRWVAVLQPKVTGLTEGGLRVKFGGVSPRQLAFLSVLIAHRDSE